MISRLIPLPMPNSSICSPSHMRKIVPAVIVITATNCQISGSRPSTRKAGWINDCSPTRCPERNATYAQLCRMQISTVA